MVTVDSHESAQHRAITRVIVAEAGMMIRTRSRLHRFAMALAVALAMSSGSTVGHAFTAEQQRLCTGDAFRLCGSEIPNLERITLCMRQHIAELSQGCRSVFEK
jgi:hypothetical protein